MLESANIPFWEVHGIFFVIFMFIFPRLTMLFTGICFAPYFGILAWIGWVIAPRLLVAILATYFYWRTNPIVCIITWIWALGGESTEKTVSKKVIVHRHYHFTKE